MKKVGFFQSVRLKLIVVYILLLLLGIQVIGAYFVKGLEGKLKDNFTSSIEGRIDTLTYSLQQSFSADRTEDDPTLETDVTTLIDRFKYNPSSDINKLQVVNDNKRIIASFGYQGNNIGQKTTELKVTNALLMFGSTDPEIMVDADKGERVWVGVRPIIENSEAVGAVYYQADMSSVYNQLQDINKIFAKGTLLAITITALLGILVARTITRPLSEMRRQAQIMSTGDFSQKVTVHGNDEISQLGLTFNDLNDKLKLSQATTEGERRKLSSVLSNMSDGVIATDRLGAITLMNAPASSLIGQSFEEVQGQSLIDILDLNEQLSDVTEIENTDSIITDLSTDDQHLLLKANFSIVINENDERDGFITVLSDVTEQEKVEQERREFVSNVSHELRTPLTSMRSYIEALNDGAWQDPEIAPRFLDVTQNETERMIRLVNDLLQLTKMDQQETHLMKETVEFIGFLNQVIERFEMNKYEHIEFDRDFPDKEMLVWIDEDKLMQVLDNVISNAIKYSPEGGTIRFKAISTKKHLRVSISDEGLGMPANTVDKIFDRFYRVDKARTRELGGTGLGLAIAREIIDAHHGKIWAESKEGKGTTVLFTLPLMSQKRRGKL